MALVFFLIEAVIISLSGVMAPGPLSAVVVGTGTKSPHAGAYVALGHGVVEFPLMVGVFYGVGYLLHAGYVKTAVLLMGGTFLLFMAYEMFRSMRHTEQGTGKLSKQPFRAGILLSAGNVYFLLWWATVGASLLARAFTFGIIGILTFAIVHWLCDLVWMYFLSTVSYHGGNVLGVKFQKAVYGISGMFLMFFGVKFMIDAVMPYVK